MSRRVAIVGAACRFPGKADDLDGYWRLLDGEIDAASEVPPDRWDVAKWVDPNPDVIGKTYTARGAFLSNIDRFDAWFFQISPREARSIAPEQRLVLEVAWEALEDAGLVLEHLRDARAGVFVGTGPSVYGDIVEGVMPLRSDVYAATGRLTCFEAGRLSYVLGFRGPSLAVDTACSSALVAIHLACRSLQNGECSVALAGAVNVLLNPISYVDMSRMRALSRSGVCRAFDAGADGYVRGEGCGMVVLKLLDDALRDGDRIHAVIRGSAVNHDGASSGLTVPSRQAQEELLRAALHDAEVAPHDIDYVEAHGTGTPLGDPIEAAALGSVLARGRPPERPLLFGSVKTNLGHLEPAAGMASLLKVILAFRHQRVPAQLNLRTPSPSIPWREFAMRVPTEPHSWPRDPQRPRLAGVSAFGISGTNAHIILEDSSDVAELDVVVARATELVVLSARLPQALDDGAERLRTHLEAHPEQSLGDVAFSFATTRTHHEHRLAFAVRSREELSAALRIASTGVLPAGAVRDEVQSGKVSFLFTGQGAQTLGMGQGLYGEWPAFRDALDAAWLALDAHLPRKLREVMWAERGTPEASLLHQTEYTQPALFALEVALSALWRSWGVIPDYVMGHSIGELAAAHVAGVFSLEDAARLVVARGRLMQALPAGGAMVAIGAPEATVLEALAPHGANVSIAAINGPESVVISGTESIVLGVAEAFAKQGIRTKRLEVSHAFHSSQMDGMLAEFGVVAESITYRSPRIPVVSNVTGALSTDELTRAAYWVRQVREAVRFNDGIVVLHGKGVRRFVEIGPKATLLGMVSSCLSEPEQEQVRLVQSLSTDKAEPVAIVEALASHYASGGTLDWAGVFPRGRRRVELPTYAWQRERHWLSAPKAGRRQVGDSGWSLIDTHIDCSDEEGKHVFEFELDATEGQLNFLVDYKVQARIQLPTAVFVEIALEAASVVFAGRAVAIEELAVSQPLTMTDGEVVRVQLVLQPEVNGVSSFRISSRGGDNGWTRHATGHVGFDRDVDSTPISIEAVQQAAERTLSVETLYEDFEAGGLSYGPAFQYLEAAWLSPNAILVKLVPPAKRWSDGRGYVIHPALLDAAFQPTLATTTYGVTAGKIFLPESLKSLRVLTQDAAHWVHTTIRSFDEEAIESDLRLLDEHGNVVVVVEGLRAVPIVLGPDEVDSLSVTVRLRKAPAAQRAAIVEDAVRLRLEETLTIKPDHELNPDKGFAEIGMDSLMAMRFRNLLQRDLRRKLKITVLFEYSTIRTLTAYLVSLFEDVAKVEPTQARADANAAELATQSEDELLKLLAAELA